MPLPKLNLRVLEAFEYVARHGSMRAAAREMGMSISSVSHYVAQLEKELGVVLIDRASRPFGLTREGQAAAHHLSRGLQHLRRATRETAIGGLLSTRSLRIGIVEDFESSVAPDLAVTLARRMPRAALSVSHVLSHEAPHLLLKGSLDLAVASEAHDLPADIAAELLLRDPFVLATPAGLALDPADLLQGAVDLPFLRFNRDHLIGKQIDAHLARNRIALRDRYAFDSVQSIMAVIANGEGWSILTPLGFLRAQRYTARVTISPLPFAAFARRISLMARGDFDGPTSEAIATLLRQSIRQTVVEPVRDLHPWLGEAFHTPLADD